MSTYQMTAREVILTAGSSKGTQVKFYRDGYWYKLNERGYENRAEALVSAVLSCSNLPEDQYVRYESCIVEYEGRRHQACRSKSFLLPDEQFISYERLYKMFTGRELNGAIIPLDSPEERIRFVEDMIREYTGADPHRYIADTLALDMFTLNVDRHFNNLGLIASMADNSYRNAPIFDNGAALLSDISRFPPGIPFDELEIYSKPFSANFEYQAAAAGIRLRIDFNRLEERLKDEEPSRALEILRRQMERYQKVLHQSLPDVGEE